jgi:hypothetical protein
MPDPQPSRIELIAHSGGGQLDADLDGVTLPPDLPPTKATARLYWLHHPSRPDAVKIVRPDDTEVIYDSYDYAAEQLSGVEAISWPRVIDQAERLLEKTGRKLT